MSTTIRLEDKTKREAQKLAKNLGLSFSGFINALVKKAVREGGVDLRAPKLTVNGFTPEFEESVFRAEKEGGAMSFSSIEEMIEYAKNEN